MQNAHLQPQSCAAVTVAAPTHVGPNRIGDGPVRQDYSHGPVATTFAPLPATIQPGTEGFVLAALPQASPTWVLVLWGDYGALWHPNSEIAPLQFACPHCDGILQTPYTAAYCPDCQRAVDVDQMLAVLPA